MAVSRLGTMTHKEVLGAWSPSLVVGHLEPWCALSVAKVMGILRAQLGFAGEGLPQPGGQCPGPEPEVLLAHQASVKGAAPALAKASPREAQDKPEVGRPGSSASGDLQPGPARCALVQKRSPGGGRCLN